MKNTNRIAVRISNGKRLFAAILCIALLVPVLALAQPPQPPVPLGAAGGFSILAASLISSVPTAAITGNVGLSPASGSEITGLTAGEVNGTIYTVDVSGPAGTVMAPALLTAAQGDLTIAFNDAAGRTPTPVGDFLNPGSGNIGGMTLPPGLYKFTSTASIIGLDLTLSGSSTDVWIFQIASDLNVGNGVHVVLAGGARAENIFWQVGTSATLGTTSIFKGIILADQSISLNTGATVDGRLLARIAAVTIDASTITGPAPIDFMISSQMTEFPAGGGVLSYTIHLRSYMDVTVPNLHFWTTVLLPNGTEFGPLFHRQFTLTPFMEVNLTGMTQNIPALAPSGTYEFRAYLGYLAGPNLMDSFTFEKLGMAQNGVSSWAADGDELSGSATDTHAQPSNFTLNHVYPNPFNPTADVSVVLPVSTELTVLVYNTLGQQVAELAQGQFSAGTHNFVIDGSNLSSGIYFVHASVPGEMNAIQKVTLMK